MPSFYGCCHPCLKKLELLFLMYFFKKASSFHFFHRSKNLVLSRHFFSSWDIQNDGLIKFCLIFVCHVYISLFLNFEKASVLIETNIVSEALVPAASCTDLAAPPLNSQVKISTQHFKAAFSYPLA